MSTISTPTIPVSRAAVPDRGGRKTRREGQSKKRAANVVYSIIAIVVFVGVSYTHLTLPTKERVFIRVV